MFPCSKSAVIRIKMPWLGAKNTRIGLWQRLCVPKWGRGVGLVKNLMISTSESCPRANLRPHLACNWWVITNQMWSQICSRARFRGWASNIGPNQAHGFTDHFTELNEILAHFFFTNFKKVKPWVPRLPDSWKWPVKAKGLVRANIRCPASESCPRANLTPHLACNCRSITSQMWS